ncbi:MAG: hypothetical protein IPO81_13775 [Kouleothrix sp.]|nr:hypothetical protein [Kouleothrix sp.]
MGEGKAISGLKLRCVTNRFQLVRNPEGHLSVGDDDVTPFLIPGKLYDLLGVEEGWYRIVDEEGEDYLYPPYLFEPIEAE